MSTTTAVFQAIIGQMIPWVLGLAALALVADWLAPPRRAHRRRRAAKETDVEVAAKVSVMAAATGFAAIATPLTWLGVVAVVLALLAAFAWWRIVRHQQAIARTGYGRAELRRLSPSEFERWCAARLREQGYAVDEVGGPSDHGVDLIATRDGETTIVQCKRWFAARLIGEPVIRDLYGAMHDAGADEAMLVTTGEFSEAALLWAKDKPVRLWTVDRLASFAGAIALAAPTASATPRCARCGRAMVERVHRGTGEPFWGCPGFPDCRYTRPI